MCFHIFLTAPIVTHPTTNRCFPRFPDEIMGSVVSVLNASATVAASAAGTLASQYSSAGSQLATYIADISKGILIVLVGGLGGGIVLSLVSGEPGEGEWGEGKARDRDKGKEGERKRERQNERGGGKGEEKDRREGD